MNEEKTNENLAQALDTAVEDLGLAQEVIEEEAEPIEVEEAQEVEEASSGGDAEGEEKQPETDDTDSGQGDSMPYAEATTIKAALAGDGLPQGLIEALSEDELRSYMSERSKRDAAFDRLRSKLNAFDSTDETDDAKKAAAEGAPKESDTPLPQVDLDALTAEFGDEEAKQIADYVKSEIQTATQPLLGALEQMIDHTQRSRLSGAVPDDLGENWYEKTRERAIELSFPGAFSDKAGQARQDALFDAALHLEFPDLPSQAEMKKETKRAKQRRNGTPSRSGRTSNRTTGLSKDEAMDARVQFAMEGKTPEEIRRLVP